TGGASGIGLETARVLALHKAHVIIAARNITAANEARRLILKDIENARVDVLLLDLASLKSVAEFADSFKSLNLPLNILINNAGVMFCPYKTSEDGIELQFATNHLGHFLLTNLLLEKMKETARATGVQGRIVNLSSIAHIHTYRHGIAFDHINDQKRYSDKRAYGQSKLANILHAKELSRRLQEEGVNITGAATTCYAALHPAMKGVTGKYLADCNEVKPSAYAMDEMLAKNLWDFSIKLIHSATAASKP
ncbi:Short-chain dehydrogenase TIC 32 B, chloroplastic, partial [Linum perenne]